MRAGHWVGAAGGGAFMLLALRGIRPVDVLWLGFVALAAFMAGAALWHRRRVLEILQMEADAIGSWRRVHWSRPWPRYCAYCGHIGLSWPQVKLHVCAAMLDELDDDEAAELDAAPVAELATAVPAAELVAAGNVDTFTDNGGQAAELDPGGRRARSWEHMAALIERTTRGQRAAAPPGGDR